MVYGIECDRIVFAMIFDELKINLHSVTGSEGRPLRDLWVNGVNFYPTLKRGATAIKSLRD